MRILIATGLYPPEIGGPATYTKMLEEHLPEHGMQLLIVPYGWVRRYPRIVRHLVFVWKIVRTSTSCDIIYALDPVSVGLPALIASKIVRKPLLLRIAGDYAWEQGQQRFGVKDTLDAFLESEEKPHPFVRLLASIERYVARKARCVIVPSAYMKKVVERWGVSGDKIAIIYSALIPLIVTEQRDAIRTMFNYKGLVLVTAGRLVPWKGIGTLISLMPELIRELNNVTLVIAGDGPLMEALQRRAEELKVSESVRFVGRLPKDSLGTVIKGADVFVLNSAYEGMSHQLLEVMDLGVPIVTTDVGGNPELITDGITGLLVSHDDSNGLKQAILRMSKQEQLREQITQHARLRVRDFLPGKVTKELADVLERI